MIGASPVTYNEVSLFHLRCEDLFKKGWDLLKKEEALLVEKAGANAVAGNEDNENKQEIRAAVTAFFLEAEQVKSEVNNLKGRVKEVLENRELINIRPSEEDLGTCGNSEDSGVEEDVYLDGIALATYPHKLGGVYKMINEISENVNDLKKEIF
ncbi:MAG: archaellum component FlaC [Chlamydiales bacterium]|jgi:archaellum component FlaC